MTENPTEESLFETLSKILKEQGRPDEDLALVRKGFEYARLKHEGQLRKNGENYIVHPVHVSTILAKIPVDTPTVIAALLHDVLEDTDAKPAEIQQMFGEEVLTIVEGVTKLGKLQFESKQERNAENSRKMFLAMANDVRVVLLKLCDRLHNMRTLEHLAPEKQQKKARETLEIFAPLANRMGMGNLRAELEDLSLKFLDTEAFTNLVTHVEEHKADWEAGIKQMQEKLNADLEQLGVHARIYGRVKNYFSIYKKMKRHQKQFQDIYDLSALRVIILSENGQSEKECYEALGVVHSNFKPIPGRFKDYIAMPKNNLYRSLHTSIIGPTGRPIEVQIRTEDMHRIAEYGIAAHWKYKEAGGSVSAESLEEQKLSWLKQMLELKEETGDAQEYVENVKLDLFRDEVFVFTPRGDVYDLPQGATPVDFAYKVHTQVGNTCTGALVNGKIVTLDYQLRNGDIIEIITSKKANPRLDWIKFVQTQHAKSCIRQWFKKNFREDHIEQGKMLLEAELTRAGMDEAVKSGKMLEIAQQLNYTKLEDMLMALGYGELTLPKVVNRLKREKTERVIPTPESFVSSSASLAPRRKSTKEQIEGLEGMLYNFAKCCSPLPGDGIMGAVTRSRGVMIHRDDCINLSHVSEGRVMAISWTGYAAGIPSGSDQQHHKREYHTVRLEVHVIDRLGIFKDVLSRIADINTNISNARVKILPNNTAIIELAVDIADIEHLEKVRRAISKLSDVMSVTRVQVRPVKKADEDSAE